MIYVGLILNVKGRRSTFRVCHAPLRDTNHLSFFLGDFESAKMKE